MILYVNGDSNAAAAEAVNTYGFAEDDSNAEIQKLGRQPHPDNVKVSFGKQLADLMEYTLVLDAESASSNDRIIRTTYEHLQGVQNLPVNRPNFVLIGWSTWEREEWWDPDTNRYWQVNAGGIGHDWPDSIKKRYKTYIANLDIQQSISRAANKIWLLHETLQNAKINHLFFNCFEPLSGMPEFDWSGCYLEPYNPEYTYYNWLIKNGYTPVYKGSYHFGPEAHTAWAKFLYQNIVQTALTKN